MSSTSLPPDPSWVYPVGTSLALKFSQFNNTTPTQQSQAFSILDKVLEAARDHPAYQHVPAYRRFKWQDEVMSVSIVRSIRSGLYWVDVIGTVLAMKDFISRYSCAPTTVTIERNGGSRYALGFLVLMY